MATDWIKNEDEAFDTQNKAMRTWLGTPANAALAGVGTGEVNNLVNAGTNWDTTYAAHKTHVTAGLPITAGKNTSRDILENVMRPLAKLLRAKRQSGALTDAQILAAGLPLVDDTQTASPTPTTHPVLAITPAQRLEHTVRWTDESTPGSRAKPAGVKDMELRVAVVAQGAPAPSDPEAFTYYRVNAPASPNIVGYDPADAGKQAYMIGAWVSTRGERGPWSALVVGETIRA